MPSAVPLGDVSADGRPYAWRLNRGYITSIVQDVPPSVIGNLTTTNATWSSDGPFVGGRMPAHSATNLTH